MYPFQTFALFFVGKMRARLCNLRRDSEAKVRVGDTLVDVSSTFTMVGIVLFPQPLATQHLTRRVESALRSATRLCALRLPAPLVARLWRTVVLAQACYGAEAVDVKPTDAVRFLELRSPSVWPDGLPRRS